MPATFDLSAYAGKAIELRVRYRTDPAAQGNDPDLPAGIFVDAYDRRRGAAPSFYRRGGDVANGWTSTVRLGGRHPTTAYDNYYIASYRAYVSYDQYLKTGPYNFGFPRRARLRRALPVPERTARVVLGHLAGRQLHR